MNYSDQNTENQLTQEVYGLFGIAYYLSECVHKNLCNVYALLTFRSKSDVTEPRLDEKRKQAFSMTLGQIAGKVKPLLSADLQTDLDLVLKRRNFLAHYFWFERGHLLSSTDGLKILSSELNDLAKLFWKFDDDVEEYAKPLLSSYGIDDKAIQSFIAEAKAGKAVAPFPDKRYLKKQERIVRAWDVPPDPDKPNLVFESDDGALWQLCDIGLGWSPYDKVGGTWGINENLQPFLPATINPRPKISDHWNYSIRLSAAASIWVAKGKDEPNFRYGITTAPNGD